MDNNTEDQLFDLAVDALKKNIDLPFDIKIGKKDLQYKDKVCSRLLRLRINKEDLFFCAEIKTIVNKATVGLLLHQKTGLPHDQLLIAGHINNNLADELKKNMIQFIDAAGNTYINTKPLYIYIKGNKKPEILARALPKRAFEPAGLKIIFTLLREPEVIKNPYRKIAEVADVALGTVGWVMQDLREMGYLVEMGKRGRKLLQKEQLFYRWCADYTERLKPKLFLGRFGGSGDWWKNYDPDFSNAQWGGEVAAYRLTQYLKPQNIILYAQGDHYKNIIIQNRLYKDATGDIEFFERFWLLKKEEKELKDVVHPILVYADPIGTGNQRNIEAARMIYEKYINRHLKEDR
jgi:hypothetical protein